MIRMVSWVAYDLFLCQNISDKHVGVTQEKQHRSFWWNYWRLRISKSNKNDGLVSRSALADTTWAMVVETQPTKIHGVSRGIESMPGRNILNSGHIFAFLDKSAGYSIEGQIYSIFLTLFAFLPKSTGQTIVRYVYVSALIKFSEVWEWINTFIRHFIGHVITYPYWDKS